MPNHIAIELTRRLLMQLDQVQQTHAGAAMLTRQRLCSRWLLYALYEQELTIAEVAQFATVPEMMLHALFSGVAQPDDLSARDMHNLARLLVPAPQQALAVRVLAAACGAGQLAADEEHHLREALAAWAEDAAWDATTEDGAWLWQDAGEHEPADAPAAVDQARGVHPTPTVLPYTPEPAPCDQRVGDATIFDLSSGNPILIARPVAGNTPPPASPAQRGWGRMRFRSRITPLRWASLGSTFVLLLLVVVAQCVWAQIVSPLTPLPQVAMFNGGLVNQDGIARIALPYQSLRPDFSVQDQGQGGSIERSGAANGRPTVRVTPDGLITRFAYDSDGQLRHTELVRDGTILYEVWYQTPAPSIAPIGVLYKSGPPYNAKTFSLPIYQDAGDLSATEQADDQRGETAQFYFYDAATSADDPPSFRRFDIALHAAPDSTLHSTAHVHVDPDGRLLGVSNADGQFTALHPAHPAEHAAATAAQWDLSQRWVWLPDAVASLVQGSTWVLHYQSLLLTAALLLILTYACLPLTRHAYYRWVRTRSIAPARLFRRG